MDVSLLVQGQRWTAYTGARSKSSWWWVSPLYHLGCCLWECLWSDPIITFTGWCPTCLRSDCLTEAATLLKVGLSPPKWFHSLTAPSAGNLWQPWTWSISHLLSPPWTTAREFCTYASLCSRGASEKSKNLLLTRASLFPRDATSPAHSLFVEGAVRVELIFS